MGQGHVHAAKRKTKGGLQRMQRLAAVTAPRRPAQRPDRPERPESQQGLHPTAALRMPECEGACNGDNRGSESSRRQLPRRAGGEGRGGRGVERWLRRRWRSVD